MRRTHLKSHITELTICDVQGMDRVHLIESCRELCNFMPGQRRLGSLDRMPLADLRKVVNLVRRSVQARGY